MKKTSVRENQAGVAHLGLVILSLLIVGVVAFAAYRVSNNGSGNSDNSTSTSKSEGSIDPGDDEDAVANEETLNKTSGTEENDE